MLEIECGEVELRGIHNTILEHFSWASGQS